MRLAVLYSLKIFSLNCSVLNL